MLEINNLSVSFDGAIALAHVSLAVEPRSVVAVIGPNGAGKTSLLRAVSGVVKATGSIRFDGQEVCGEAPHHIVRRGIIHCPQSAQLFGEMSIRENLLLGAYGRGGAQVSESMEHVVELFPALKPRLRQRAGTLSGGERQMVAIGRSLMGRPVLLLLDEPSLGLAPVVRDRIEESLHRIVHDWGLTVLLVEQDTALALDIADKVCVMDSGCVVKVAPPVGITNDPALQEAYLGIA